MENNSGVVFTKQTGAGACRTITVILMIKNGSMLIAVLRDFSHCHGEVIIKGLARNPVTVAKAKQSLPA